MARAPEQTGEERRLRRVERGYVAAEVVARRGGDPVHADRPALPQVDVVQVGLEDLPLRMRALEGERDPRLAELAPQVALGGEEQVLHELLGQRAAAFHHPSRPKVGPGGAHDPLRVEAAVVEEAAVLDRQHRVDHRGRQAEEPHRIPVARAAGVGVREPDGLDDHRAKRPAGRIRHRRHEAGAVEAHVHDEGLGRGPGREALREGPEPEAPAPGLSRELSGPDVRSGDATIAGRAQVALELLRLGVEARLEHERTAVQARRRLEGHSPEQRLAVGGDRGAGVRRHPDEESESDGDGPAQAPSTGRTRALLGSDERPGRRIHGTMEAVHRAHGIDAPLRAARGRRAPP